MTKRQALVKDLPSVETLGRTTIICCDKTLIENIMVVHRICVDGHVVEVSGTDYELEGKLLDACRARELLCGRRFRLDSLTLARSNRYAVKTRSHQEGTADAPR